MISQRVSTLEMVGIPLNFLLLTRHISSYIYILYIYIYIYINLQTQSIDVWVKTRVNALYECEKNADFTLFSVLS